MTNNYTKIVNVILDELNIKELPVTVETPTLDTKEFLSKKRKPKIFTGLCKLEITKDLDEDGLKIVEYTVSVYTNREEIATLTRITKDNRRRWLARLEEYLENINVELNDCSDFVLHVLHELGHMNQIELFRKNGRIEQYVHVRKVMDITIDLAFGIDSLIKYSKEEGRNLEYQLKFSELHADNFMYIKFPKIWKRLKEEGLVH